MPMADLKNAEFNTDLITDNTKNLEVPKKGLKGSRKVKVKRLRKCTSSTPSIDTLVAKLRSFGYNPGPIVDSTRNLYIKKLEKLKKEFKSVNESTRNSLKVNFEQQKGCVSTTSLPSATIVTTDLMRDEFKTEPVVDSTKNVYMDGLEELNKGTKCDDVDKPTPPLNVNPPKACTSSTPSIDTLVAELRSFGYNPGPIVDSTKNLYVKKLEQLKQGIKYDKKKKLGRSLKALNVEPPKKRTSSHSRLTIPTRFGCNSEPKEDNTKNLNNKDLENIKKGSKCDNVDQSSRLRKTLQVNVTQTIESCRDQIEKYLLSADWMRDLRRFIRLEKEARQDFTDASKGWSSGNSKKSFIYLLLDPRITKNLPVKLTKLNKNLQWTTFIHSVFYVGTGENEGPYKHLIEARALREKTTRSKDKKIQLILDIWKDDMGVICLQVFHNIIPDEAYTYEAAMIDALGLKNLTNLMSGSYKGVVESWTQKKRSMLGVYLLYKAMQSYLHEGERQLRPNDL